MRRLLRRPAPPIPEALWRDALEAMPFLDRLNADEGERLRVLCAEFLARHRVGGAAGFEMTDAIATRIAAQACLPVLNLTLALYDDLAGVIVYPSAFLVRHSEIDEAGVVHEWDAEMAGEALDAGGAIALSWEDAHADTICDDGGNLVLHEFVHKIDMRDGNANGCPPFLAAFHRGLDAREWKDAFSAAYADFCGRVDALEARLPRRFDPDRDDHADLYAELAGALPLDPYAAEHPAEFFAVASEAFFCWPEPLATAYPRVYTLLAAYFRQETLSSAQAS
ncbi:M90 family metallopeptidase [Noviherbaspirillum pedocola]